MVNGVEYGCSFHRNRGEAACENDLRVKRRIVESRLMDTILASLFTDDAVARFREEVQRQLTTRDVATERRTLTRELGAVRREAANLVQAIKDGVRAELVKDALEDCDRRRVDVERRLTALAQVGDAGATIADRLDGFSKALAGLRRLAEQDVDAARDQLRRLVGKIELFPYEGQLVAHLSGDLFGLLGLTAAGGDVLLWRESQKTAAIGRFDRGGLLSQNMVAGARFGLCALFRAPGLENLAHLM
jgi:hypothetical protein